MKRNLIISKQLVGPVKGYANSINLSNPEKIRDHHNANSDQKDSVGFEPEEGKKLELPPEDKVESYNVDHSKKEQKQKNKKAEKKKDNIKMGSYCNKQP